MISYWKLDETSGTTYDDYYNGNDGDGSVSPPTPSTDGVAGGSQGFNGTSDFITVADDPSLDWASDASFTIELWAKFTNVSSRNKVMIGRDEAGGTHWWLGAKQNTGQVNWNMKATDGNGGAVTSDIAINDGEWHHIVAVRDESTDENRLYIDGVFEKKATYDYTAGFDATTTLGIGYMAYHFTPTISMTGYWMRLRFTIEP